MCSNARRAMYFNGLPEQKIHNITIEDVFITSKIGGEIAESENIVLRNVTIHPEKGEALLIKNCDGVQLNGFQGEVVEVNTK